MKATHLDSKRTHTHRGYDLVQLTFQIDPPIDGIDRVVVSMHNDDSCDEYARTRVYLGSTDYGSKQLLPEPSYPDMPIWHRDAVSALASLGYEVLDRNGVDPFVALPREIVAPDAHIRRNHSFRVGDVVIANDDASDLSLKAGDVLRVEAVSGYSYGSTTITLVHRDDEERRVECNAFHPGIRPARYRWTVEIEVDARWVADGIDLDARTLDDLTMRAFPYLSSSEVRARAIGAPDAEDVAREMGYRNAADRKARSAKK